MKVYKKIMNGVAFVEKLILVLSTILIVVLTVGNVLSRKILHQSWSFTEELVVAVFVLITLLAAALAARDGGQSFFTAGPSFRKSEKNSAGGQHGFQCCIYRSPV